MDSLNNDNQADVIEAFNSTSRYLDDLLNIDNFYFECMANQMYPPDLQLNKASISETVHQGTSRQRSGKGAIRKRFPLQKPRWGKKQTNNHVLIPR